MIEGRTKCCVEDTTHVCGLNNEDELQKIGEYRIHRGDTLPRRRLILNTMMDKVSSKVGDQFGDLVICKSALDSQIAHILENLMIRDFEKLLIVPSHICIIARSAKTDGVVIEISETGTSCCAIYDGTIVRGSFVKNNKIGAQNVTDQLLQQLWLNRGYEIPTALSYIVGDFIKRRWGFVQYGPMIPKLKHLLAHTNCLLKDTGIVLPDGNELLIDQERYLPYEPLFVSERAIPMMLSETIGVLDTWGRADMKDQILISGGSKDTPGLLQRVQEIPIPVLKTS